MLPAKTDPRLYVKSPAVFLGRPLFAPRRQIWQKGLHKAAFGGGRGGTPCFHIAAAAAAAAALPSRRGSTRQPTWQWQKGKGGEGEG